MKRRTFLADGLFATGFGFLTGQGERGSSAEKSKNAKTVLPEVSAADTTANSTGRVKTISEPGRELAISGEADVVVCGGGPAGIAAAIGSARSGAKTILIESQNCLGGIWTAGELCLLLDQNGKRGIMNELLQELGRRQALRGGVYDVETMKYILDRLCLESGVDIRLYTRVTGVVKTTANRIRAVVTESKSGREAVLGRYFIDSTGDGDLAAQAGCGYDFGNPKDGSFQPMSLMALLTGLDANEVMPFTNREKFLAELRRARFEPSYRLPSLWYLNGRVWGLMATHLHGLSGTNARDLTTATLRGRRELYELTQALRGLGGIWSKLWLVSTAQYIGVREGRRIHGLYTITEQDVLEGKKQPDAVCRVSYPVDIHISRPPRPGESSLARFVPSKPYDIPLRSLISRDIDNLLMAGRCISGDFTAHASYRVTGNAVPMGEAAGKKAAENVKAEKKG